MEKNNARNILFSVTSLIEIRYINEHHQVAHKLQSNGFSLISPLIFSVRFISDFIVSIIPLKSIISTHINEIYSRLTIVVIIIIFFYLFPYRFYYFIYSCCTYPKFFCKCILFTTFRIV